MALTRKFLAALGIEEAKIEEIISAHTETTDGLKKERDGFRAEAEKLPGVQRELDELKAEAAKNGGESPFEVKYNALKEEFDQYRADQTAKEAAARKTAAYRALLQEAGVSEKRIGAVLRVSDLDSVELDEDGKIKGADKLMESVKTEWADFIVTESTQGAVTATPPTGTAGAPNYDEMSDADYYRATYEAGRKG